VTADRPFATVLYDEACPFCAAEMRMLRRWDHTGILRTVDISAPEFRAEDWGLSMSALSAELHVRSPGGDWLKGMAAIRHLYQILGRGRFLEFTGWPVLSPVFDALYRRFARNRMQISRRLGLAKGARCRDGHCS
jgi:predicted DCC family thiol-disulfide oxidoreductase YuxK